MAEHRTARGHGQRCRVRLPRRRRRGPLALCLHGFPDSAHTWRHLLPALADGRLPRRRPVHARLRADRRARRRPLPDRGAGDGRARPARGARRRRQGGDHRPRLGRARPPTARRCTRRSGGPRSSTMAVPPGGALGAAFLGDLAQLKRSWYMFFFQHPLADVVVPADDLAFIDMLWADWSPGYDADAGRRRTSRTRCATRPTSPPRSATTGPRSATATVDPALDERRRPPRQPTRRSRRSTCTAPTTAASASRWPSVAARAVAGQGPRCAIFEGCGHFLHLEHPQASTTRIVEFLAMTAHDDARTTGHPTKPVLPDGLVVVVKEECETCRMVGRRCSPPPRRHRLHPGRPGVPRRRRRHPRRRPRRQLAPRHRDRADADPRRRRRRGRAHRRLAARRLAAHHRRRRPRRRPAR